METNTDRNSTVEPRKQLAANIDKLLVTPAVKPAPNVMPFVLLDLPVWLVSSLF